ncbi:MAG: carotenoid oxygenase family protein [Pseudomonadota bacterium]|nr:carotenoid oxygenase family protein [Pseudomonadota bacterium]
MDRRTFLTGTALAGLAGLLPAGLARATGLDDRARAFRAALAERPWLAGWQTAAHDSFRADPSDIVVEGRIPAGLDGDLIRNGPAGHEVFGHRYRHWFDGDGLVHRFRIADGRIRHDGRLLMTPKRRAEIAAGGPVFAAFDTPPPATPPTDLPDAMNVANISVIHHGGRLQALWEGGSASVLDEATLEFREFAVMSDETRGLPVTAHPRRDPDGTLWSFGYAGYAGKVLLYRLAPDGTLTGVHVIDAAPTPMIHDFMVTERHIVFILTPFVFDRPDGATFLERHAWRPEQGGTALVLQKSDPSIRRFVELPAFWVYHFSNAWADGPDRIRFGFPRYPDPSATTGSFRAVMDGSALSGTFATWHEAVLDLDRARYSETPVIEGPAAEFPRVHPDLTGRRTDRTVMLLADAGAAAAHPFFTTTAMLDGSSGRVDAFRHGATELAEEAIYVPAGADERGGWILNTVLDYAAGRTRLKVFEADNVSGGPVAVASLPYALPLGLHGTFVKA